jgi:hypothetical protein
MVSKLYTNDFTKDSLVLANAPNSKVICHKSNDDIKDFNEYAMGSLALDNDARRRSTDEAISIHIITTKLHTRLNILYEAQICQFYGKPDFIIRLGKKLYIVVSTTRAVRKNKEFNQLEADRLVNKKIKGLLVYSKNVECLVDDVVYKDHMVRPVLHILSPNKENAKLCLLAYKKIKSPKLDNIKVIITLVTNDELL